jgi:hypothetical protein
MLAHDLLADGLHRRDIRKLVNLPGNVGHLSAVIGNKTYNKGSHNTKDPSGKVRTVAFQYGENTENFVLDALHNKALGSKLDINRLFARVMCESLPARINYELAAVYNVHMEDLYQQSKTSPAPVQKTSKRDRFRQWLGSNKATTNSLEVVKEHKGFMKNSLSKLQSHVKKEWYIMSKTG